jgi:chitin synthase
MLTSSRMRSGKFKCKEIVFKYIAMLCGQPKKEARIMKQIQSASEVVEAFGHATTTNNTNASRVGTFTEITFNERGRLYAVSAASRCGSPYSSICSQLWSRRLLSSISAI